MDKKQKRVAGVLIGIIIIIVIMMIEFVIFSKGVEADFKSLHVKLSEKILGNGYSKYLAQDADEESYDQFRYNISHMSAGINSNIITYGSGEKLMVMDVHTYLDSDMNSIMADDTLMLVNKTNTEKGKEIFYQTFHDEMLGNEIHSLISQYKEKVGELVFNVKVVYVKGNEFIPENVTYYEMGEGGSISREHVIYSCDKSEEELLNEGYEKYKVGESFCLGDINDSENPEKFIIYYAGIEDERKNRINALLEESKKLKPNQDDGSIFISKKEGLLMNEYFNIHEMTFDENNKYYAIEYEKKNVMFDVISYATLDGRRLLLGLGVVFEMIVLFVLIILAIIFTAGLMADKKNNGR